jgi:nicotinamidase-related amidase
MALLIVDVTDAFVGENVPTVQAARQCRTACGAPAWQSLGPIRTLIDAFHDVGSPVIYTKALPEAHLGGATIGVAEAGAGNTIVSAIAPTEDDIVIEKARPSAFFGTPLAAYLLRSNIRGLVIVGGSTSGCVRASTVDASSWGFSVALAHDGCFDRSQLSHSVAVFELGVKYAVIVDSAAASRELRQAATASHAAVKVS